MTVLVIAANNLRLLLRERANLFFVFVLPLLLILVLGVTVGGDEPRIGVYVDGDDSPAAQELIAGLDQLDGVVVERFDGLDAASEELEREDITALVVVPANYAGTLTSGGVAELEYRAIPTSGGAEMQSLVQSVVADQNAVIRASRLVEGQTGVGTAEATQRVDAVATDIATVDVVTVDSDGAGYVDADAVGFVAAQELILFMFLMGMVAASALIQSRQLGVTQRMLATPATAAHIVAGEGLGRFAIAVVQGVFIIGATALLFGLGWGSWLATGAIVVSFALVATAAALLVGALVDNESQSSAIGISLGLALAALGGCMVPFEVFPDWLRSLAHITPHAWAVDAFSEVVQRGGGLGQIGTEIAVLLTFGVSMLAGASIALRRAIVS